MKKFIILFAAVIGVACVGTAVSYIMQSPNISLFSKKVSTYEELMSASGKIILTEDIDCNFQTITTRNIISLDGEGHSIKNFVITASGATNECAFFSNETKSIKNVTFEGATVNGDSVLGLSIVKLGGGGTIENVHVKNSTISATQSNYYPCYIGGIYAGAMNPSVNSSFVGYLGRYETSYDAIIKNCSVENLTIKLTGHKNFSGNSYSIYSGGIAGACNSISNSFTKNCNIVADSQDTYCYPYVGGIVGYSCGTIVQSYCVDNTLTADASYYSGGTFSYYSTSKAYIGGIVGNNTHEEPKRSIDEPIETKIQFCYSDGNTINGNCTGDIFIGGLCGLAKESSIEQSYTKGNKLSSNLFVNSNKYSVYKNMGGLIGLAEKSIISSCFTYDNQMVEKSSASSRYSKAGGLLVMDDDTTVNFCGTFNNELNVPSSDEFCPVENDNIFNCYITSENYDNINNCKLVPEEFWFTEDMVKNQLKLKNDTWLYEPNCLPKLKFEW